MASSEEQTRQGSGKARYARTGDPNYQHKTYIDRRGASRVVPLEVLCLGRERCGTSSLRQALFELGYAHVYHMTAVMQENPPDAIMWTQAFDAKLDGKGKFGKEEWDQLLGHCMATCDMPTVAFDPELLAAYPSAKVILNVRDSAEAWHASALETTVAFTELLWWSSASAYNPLCIAWRFLVPLGPFKGVISGLNRALDYPNFRERGIQSYEDHNAMVRKLAGDRLLEYNVKQGWAPLCEFLGKEVPDREFPRVNDKEEFIRNATVVGDGIKKAVAIKAALYIAGAAAMVAGVVYEVRNGRVRDLIRRL